MSHRIKLPTMVKTAVSVALLLSTASAVEPIKFDYKNNGLDWEDKWAQCGQGA